MPLSLVVHGVLFGLVVLSSLINPTPPKPKKAIPRPVSIRRVDARTWASNRAVGAFKPVERTAELHPKGQVVDVAPGNNQRAPEAKYLAESDNRVQKETRAKEQTNKYSVATPTTSAHPEQLPSAKGKSAPKQEAPPVPSGVSIAESFFGKRMMSPLTPTLSPAGERESEVPSPVGTENGSTLAARGEMTEGGGAPNDDLGDVAQGDGTFLNTREWKYAAFFNRVKQAVAAKWDPNARLRSRRTGMGADRTTVVHVTLRPDGSLADCFVSQGSGLDELDAEAMNAFTKAQPFPNPPPGLVEQGAIRFGFSFHVTNEGLASSPFRFR